MAGNAENRKARHDGSWVPPEPYANSSRAPKGI